MKSAKPTLLSSHKYCEICREGGEDLEMRCGSCGGGFHSFCYREAYGDERVRVSLATGQVFICDTCHTKLGDADCFLCKRSFMTPNLALSSDNPGSSTEDQQALVAKANERQKCPGCSKAVHLGCAQRMNQMVDTSQGKLVSECKEVNEEAVMWSCRECTQRIKARISSALRVQHGRMAKEGTGGRDKLQETGLHQHFCEVCQKGGKLLLCDKCPKSFHASCIEHLVKLEDLSLQEFECPCCKGVDLFSNDMGVRLSEDELMNRLKERNEKNRKRHHVITRRRNAYLSHMISDIAPFVSKKNLDTIRAAAKFSDSRIRLGDVVSVKPGGNLTILTGDETGETQEQNRDQNVSDVNGLNGNHMNGFDASGDVIMGDTQTKHTSESKIKARLMSEPFVATCVEEANDEESLTVVPHDMPTLSLKVDKVCCVFLGSASLQSKKFPCESPCASVFLSRTKNGLDFLAEGCKLKDYQIIGTDWITKCFCDRGGCILADDMGLGKTMQALSFLAHLHHCRINGPHLIIVPVAVVGNWLREARRFVPQLRVAKVCGSQKEQEFALENTEVRCGERDLYITTYDTLCSNEAFFASIYWSTCILDEAHRIKNQQGRVRKTLSRIECSFRSLLTGTPLQNSTKELFTLLNYIWPDLLTDSKVFEETVKMDSAMDINEAMQLNETKGIVDQASFSAEDIEKANFSVEEGLLSKVKSLLDKLLLRRTKAEVLQLPPKHIRDIWLPLSPAGVDWARLIYKCQDECDNNRRMIGQMRVLVKLLLKIRIICCHPRALLRSVSTQKMFEEYSVLRSQKYEAFLQGMAGEEHMLASNKTQFLDKLLTQLYCENVERCSLWRHQHTKKPSSRPIHIGEDWRKAVTNIDLYKHEQQIYNVDGNIDKSQSCVSSATGKSTIDDALYKGHKVILFTQFQMVLDELESYCKWRKWKYLRLDGSTNKVIRELDVKEFNASDSQHIIYLMSTRAGGVGINLQSANFVTIYDQDWNPHIDSQAMDRAHRIGQNRPVNVLRLLTEWTLEERLNHRCQQKMRLNTALIDDDGHETDEKLTLNEVLNLLRHGRQVLTNGQFDGESLQDWTIPNILSRPHKSLPCLEDMNLADASMDSENVISMNESMTELTGNAVLAGALPAGPGWQPSPSSDDVSSVAGGAASSLQTPGIQTPGIATPLLTTSSSASNNGDSGSRPSNPFRNNVQLGGSSSSSAPAPMAVAPFAGQTGALAAQQSAQVKFLLQQQQLRQQNALPGGGAVGAAGLPAAGGLQFANALSLQQPKRGALKPLNGHAITDFARASSFTQNDKGQTVRRSTRIKKPVMRFIPEVEEKRQRTVYNFKYDRTCFVCNEYTFDISTGEPLCMPVDQPKGPEDSVACSPETTLVCDRCPKSFHAKCQGIAKFPKKFICSWHECQSCRRKGTDVGGLLIQCTGCPKAYCIDCFPTSFRRVYPDDSFFNRLQKQGWDAATREKMVNFECNECRVKRENQVKSLANTEEMKKKEREAMEIEKRRLKEEKKNNEKEARQRAKAEQEEARLQKKAENAKNKGKNNTKKKSFVSLEEGDATSAMPSPSEDDRWEDELALDGKSKYTVGERNRERDRWLTIRKACKQAFADSFCKLMPERIEERLKLFRCDKREVDKMIDFLHHCPEADRYEGPKSATSPKSSSSSSKANTIDGSKSDSVYGVVGLETLKQHLFDLYFEVAEGKGFTYILNHVKHAKKDQEKDADIAKDVKMLENFVPKFCPSCVIPMHNRNECPLPREQVKEGDKLAKIKAEQAPHAREKKATDDDKVYACPICFKKHKRLLCKQMPDDIFEQYRTLFDRFEAFLKNIDGDRSTDGEERRIKELEEEATTNGLVPTFDENGNEIVASSSGNVVNGTGAAISSPGKAGSSSTSGKAGSSKHTPKHSPGFQNGTDTPKSEASTGAHAGSFAWLEASKEPKEKFEARRKLKFDMYASVPMRAPYREEYDKLHLDVCMESIAEDIENLIIIPLMEKCGLGQCVGSSGGQEEKTEKKSYFVDETTELTHNSTDGKNQAAQKKELAAQKKAEKEAEKAAREAEKANKKGEREAKKAEKEALKAAKEAAKESKKRKKEEAVAPKAMTKRQKQMVDEGTKKK